MTAKHKTPKRAYVSDLTKATESIGFYEAEIKRIKKEMGVGPKIGPVPKVGPVKKVGPVTKKGPKLLPKKTKK
jgi:hypothetical protein